jgi:hypothetical protein
MGCRSSTDTNTIKHNQTQSKRSNVFGEIKEHTTQIRQVSLNIQVLLPIF